MSDGNTELKQLVEEAVRAGMAETMRDFYIERELHYQDHQFIKALREMFDTSKGEVCKTVISYGMKALITVLVFGLIFMASKQWPIK